MVMAPLEPAAEAVGRDSVGISHPVLYFRPLPQASLAHCYAFQYS